MGVLKSSVQETVSEIAHSADEPALDLRSDLSHWRTRA